MKTASLVRRSTLVLALAATSAFADDPPALTCPPDITIEIGSPVDPLHTGAATATDDSGVVCQNFSDVATAGPCPCAVDIVRSWTAVDGAGQASTCSQKIEVRDTTPPELFGVPKDGTFECGAVPPPAEVTACDNCNPVSPEGLVLHYRFSADESGIVTDASGHGHQGTVYGASYVPHAYCGGGYSFDGVNDYISMGSPFIVDGTAAFTVSFWARIIDPINTLPPTLIRLKGAESEFQFAYRNEGVGDEAPFIGFRGHAAVGNTTAPYRLPALNNQWHHHTLVYNGGPKDLPSSFALYLDGVPVPLAVRGYVGGPDSNVNELGRDHSPPAPVADNYLKGVLDEVRVYARALSAEEVAALAYRVPVTFREAASTGDCPRAATRTWTATDRCGNEATASQHLTIQDTRAPALIGVPADTALPCDAEPPPPAEVNATDACDPHPAVSLNEIVSGNPCTPKSTDGLLLCYNFNETKDGQVPDLSGHGHHATVWGATPVAEGRCAGAYAFDGVNDYMTMGDQAIVNGTDPFTISFWARTVDPADGDEPPTYIRLKSSTEFQFGMRKEGMPDEAYFFGFRGYSALRASDPKFLLGHLGAAWHHVVVEYKGGNKSLAASYALYVDGEPAAIVASGYIGGPDSNANELGRDHSPPAPVPGNYFEGTMDDLRIYGRVLSGEEARVLGGFVPEGCSRILTRTWTATDHCGNSARASQHIVYEEGPNPTNATASIQAPPDLTVECGTAVPEPDPDSVTFTTTCEGGGSVSHVGDHDEGGAGCTGDPRVIARVYRGHDGCGNTLDCTQHISVVDTTPPVLEGVPDDITLPCSNALPEVHVTAHDTCRGEVPVSVWHTNAGVGCSRTLITIWTASDPCGNTTSATQRVTYVEIPHATNVIASIHAPPSITVECGTPIPEPDTSLVTFTTTCEGGGTVTHVADAEPDPGLIVLFQNEADPDVGGCPSNPRFVLRIYRGTDDCGTTLDCTQRISVVDRTPPVLEGVPDDITISCSNALPQVHVTAHDACHGMVPVTAWHTNLGFGCSQTIVSLWTATDPCGNTIQATSIVTIVAGPVIDSDGDGIPDDWEIKHGLNPYAKDAALDSDGDGIRNYDEYVADTDPLDPASFFQHELITHNSPVKIYYQSSPDRVYSLRCSMNLESGDWFDVPDQVRIPGSGGIDFLTDEREFESCTYRVEVELP